PHFTAAQVRVLENLQKQFDVDTRRVKLLGKGELWLPADVLTAIARSTESVQVIEEAFVAFIVPLKQIVHSARLVDLNGREYVRTGVGTLGEQLPEMEEGDTVDEPALAASRALVNVMNSAGYNPFKSGAVVSLNSRPEGPATAEVKMRTVDEK